MSQSSGMNGWSNRSKAKKAYLRRHNVRTVAVGAPDFGDGPERIPYAGRHAVERAPVSLSSSRSADGAAPVSMRSLSSSRFVPPPAKAVAWVPSIQRR